MNKKLKFAVASALVAAGVAVTAPASAEQYVSAQLGISEIGSYSTAYGAYSWDNGLALIGTYGLTLPQVHQYFGIEAEISKTISNPEANDWWSGRHTEYDYWTAGGYAVFSIPVTDNINIRAPAMAATRRVSRCARRTRRRSSTTPAPVFAVSVSR